MSLDDVTVELIVEAMLSPAFDLNGESVHADDEMEMEDVAKADMFGGLSSAMESHDDFLDWKNEIQICHDGGQWDLIDKVNSVNYHQIRNELSGRIANA